MDSAATIEDVICELRLGEYGQDWALINADSSRLAEFTAYVVGHAQLAEDDVQGELLELVLASADKSLREGTSDDPVTQDVKRALAAVGRGNLVRIILDYWREYWEKQADERLQPLLMVVRAAQGT